MNAEDIEQQLMGLANPDIAQQEGRQRFLK